MIKKILICIPLITQTMEIDYLGQKLAHMTIDDSQKACMSPVHQAIMQKNLSELYTIVEPLSLDQQMAVVNESCDGVTPLARACSKRDFQIAHYLIERGADVNKPCRIKMNGTHDVIHETFPLHIVAGNGDIAIAQLLYPKLTKFDPWDSKCMTPLDYALRNNYYFMVKLLVDWIRMHVTLDDVEDYLTSRDEYDVSTYDYALRSEYPEEMISELLNLWDKEYNLFHRVIALDCHRIVKKLIQMNNAVLLLNSINQETPVEIACKNRSFCALTVLIAFRKNAVYQFNSTEQLKDAYFIALALIQEFMRNELNEKKVALLDGIITLVDLFSVIPINLFFNAISHKVQLLRWLLEHTMPLESGDYNLLVDVIKQGKTWVASTIIKYRPEAIEQLHKRGELVPLFQLLMEKKSYQLALQLQTRHPALKYLDAQEYQLELYKEFCEFVQKKLCKAADIILDYILAFSAENHSNLDRSLLEVINKNWPCLIYGIEKKQLFGMITKIINHALYRDEKELDFFLHSRVLYSQKELLELIKDNHAVRVLIQDIFECQLFYCFNKKRATWLLPYVSIHCKRKEKILLHRLCSYPLIDDYQVGAIRFLIDHGAEIAAKDNEGSTVLHMLIYQYSKNNNSSLFALVTDLCFNKHINIDERDNHGKTVLHYAAQLNQPDLIDLFLRVGANPYIFDNYDKLPGDYYPEYLIETAKSKSWHSCAVL